MSAGRVQSVAVRLLVTRERERRAFKSGSYWDLKANLQKNESSFEARIIRLTGKKIASGNDFDEVTGKIKLESNAHLISEEEARNYIRRMLREASIYESKPGHYNRV